MAKFDIFFVTTVLVLTASTSVESFPTGAGTQACIDLIPQHTPNIPQATASPYQIFLSQTTLEPGNNQVFVIVTATSGTNQYRGLALQARPADGSTDTTGSFVIDGNEFQPYDCPGSTNGGVTHTSRSVKTLPQIFTWSPDPGFSGNVQFRVTVVQMFTTFWTDIPSAILEVIGNNNLPVLDNCPGPIAVQSLPNNAGNVVTWIDPTCTDVDQPENDPGVMCDPPSGSVFQVGTTTVNCNCVDNQGETVICSFPVTITPSPANILPVVMCPDPVSVQSLAGDVGNLAMWDAPVCTDVDQPPEIDLDLTCSPASNSFFPGVGMTTVTCTCIDNQGGSDICTFPVTITSITVIPPANILPQVICPDPVSVQSLDGDVGNAASWVVDCTDVDQPPAIELDLSCTPPSNSFFPGVGTTTVTCTCIDNQGGRDMCTFPVTVTSVMVIPPGNDCEGNPCFPNECRVSGDFFTCHSMTGSPCTP